MKTDVMTVSSKKDQIGAALEQAEKVAQYKDLSHKSALHLRLLTEEVMSMMRSIAGDVAGDFWMETEGNVFSLHLKVNTGMDEAQRKQWLGASTSGKNEATRGIMGKLRAFFEPAEGLPVVYGTDMLDVTMYSDMVWSMREYREKVQESLKMQQGDAQEAWDELEKSVIFHIADDVKVSIKGHTVEMVITKTMTA